MTVPESYFDGKAKQSFYIEYKKPDEGLLRDILKKTNVQSPWFAGTMCNDNGADVQVVNCDITEKQYAALEEANFQPLLGTRYSSSTWTFPLPPRRRDPPEPYTLQRSIHVAPALRFKNPGTKP
jgi:hypothetical protein